jgi:hypothetical protein
MDDLRSLFSIIQENGKINVKDSKLTKENVHLEKEIERKKNLLKEKE